VKKVLPDLSFWILLLANLYLVYRYEQNPDMFSTIIWLYWSQSVIFGFFNFIDMLTTKTVDLSTELTPSLGSEDLPANSPEKEKSVKDATAWFFLFHFGFFHFVYFFFLITMTKLSLFNWSFFKYYLLVFVLFQVVNFIQHKIQNRNRAVDIGRMFFTPYLRVIPMHLCILIPAFLHITSLTVFLVLKVVADVFMYVLTNSYYKKDPLTEITTMNIKSIISPD
jgi:hypothetical protein